MSAYSVGIEIAAKSNVAAQLAIISKELSKLDQSISLIDSKFAAMFGRLSQMAKVGELNIASITKSLGQMGTAGETEVKKVATGFNLANRAAKRLEDSVNKTNAAMARTKFPTMTPMPAPATGGRRLSDATNAADARSSRNRGGIGSHDTMMAAMGLAGIGGGSLSLTERSVGDDFAFKQLQARLGLNETFSEDGQTRPAFTSAKIAEAAENAKRLTRLIPGSTPISNLAITREIYGQLGDPDEAIKSTEYAAKMARFFQLMDRKRGGEGDESKAILNAFRFIEDSGLSVDPNTHKVSQERIKSATDMIAQVYSGTQGRVGPDELLGFIKQARGAGVSLSTEGLLRYAPVMGALGATRSGTALSGLFQQFDVGKMTKQTFLEAQKAGIYDGSATWKGGRVINADKHLTNRDQAATNPMAWIDSVVAPGLQRLGFLTTGKDGAIAAGDLAGRTTTWGLLVEALASKAQIDKQVALTKGTNKDPYTYMDANDPTQNVGRMHSAMAEASLALGEFLAGPAIDGLKALTDTLNKLVDYAKANPDTAEKISRTVIGLGLLSGAIGTLYLTLLPLIAISKIGGAITNGLGGFLNGLGLGGGAGGAAVAGDAAAGVAGAVAPTVAGGARTLFGGVGTGLGVQYLIDHYDELLGLSPEKIKQRRAAALAAPPIPGHETNPSGAVPLNIPHSALNRFNSGTGGAFANPVGSLADATVRLTTATSALAAIGPPPPVQQSVMVRTLINLDSRTIGEAVSEHMVKQADRMPAGGNFYDPRLGNIHIDTPF